jgi:hypothetical protein
MNLMTLKITGYLIFSLIFISKAEANNISEQWKIINDAKASPDTSHIKQLGDIVRHLGRDLKNLEPESEELYNEAQHVLLSIPGHAEYYGNEIKNLTDGEIAGTSTAHTATRGWYFETLSRMPSPETVRVLGELLFDERNPFKGDPTDAPWQASCWGAEDAIFHLGLKNMPVKEGPFPFYEDDLHTWQLWYEQVRAGTRTFSFKGNDTVYTLAGPVTEASPSSPQTSHQPAGSQPAALPAQSSFPKLPIAIALVILLTAIFAVVTKSKKRFSKS